MIGTFIYNNYVQATGLLENLPIILNRLMVEMDIECVSVFDSWLNEEREYLKSLRKEPPIETLQMEYYQKLINLWASE